jgi:hypothetical protein
MNGPAKERPDFDQKGLTLRLTVDPTEPGDVDHVDLTVSRTVAVGRPGSSDAVNLTMTSAPLDFALVGLTRESVKELADLLYAYEQRMRDF